jgi:6-phosphogluconolactonase (cycloisomerase 2 family)
MIKIEKIAPAERRSGPRLAALTRFAGALVLVAFGAFSSEATAQREHEGRARNLVYVQSNNPAGNAIFAFRRAANGSLTPLPGSPFPTGGTGLNVDPTFALGPDDSDQEVIVNPDHTLLFAVNGGSNDISVLRISANGSLSPVRGSPFPSGGATPVSVGLSNNILCVVNKSQNPGQPAQVLPNYTSFRVTGQGQLIAVPRSTVSVDAGASPSQALISPDGSLLFGADFMGGLLRTFLITPHGRLIPQDAEPLPPSLFTGTNAPPFPLGLAVHPERKILYVGLVTISQVAAYRYSGSGALRFVTAVPSGKGPCWVLTNKEGTRLYSSNTGDPSISVFDISDDPTQPVEIQRVNIQSTGGVFQIALDPTESFFHVITQQSSPSATPAANAVHVLKVADDGTLTEVPSSPTQLPVPNLVRPQGVVAL